MIQIKEMTYEEKCEMYDKLNKRELIEMLIQANKVIENITHPYVPFTSPSLGEWDAINGEISYDNQTQES